MKILLLIRHAQAEKGKPDLPDADRRLTDKGKSDAAYIARQIRRLGLLPTRILCSPSIRTQKTARIMVGEWSLEPSSVKLRESLYEGDYDAYMSCICSLEDTVDTAAIVGHNPTIGWLAQSFSSSPDDSFPTCAAAVVKVDSESWQNFPQARNFLQQVLIP